MILSFSPFGDRPAASEFRHQTRPKLAF